MTRRCFVSADCVYESVGKCAMYKGKFSSDLSPLASSFQWKVVNHKITNTLEGHTTSL